MSCVSLALEQQLVERVERAVGSRTQAEGLAELARVARDRLTVLKHSGGLVSGVRLPFRLAAA